MPRITIDQRELDVPAGATILHAARTAGLHIPALCYRDGCKPNASCMTCVVKVNGQSRFVPSCATLAEDGMRVESDTPEVRAVRKAALELLLSDHTGECVAPCQSICPAQLEIPALLRHLALGEVVAAAAIARNDLVLPGVLGRICPAPCEKGCRRKDVDASVAIRATHGFLGEAIPSPLAGEGGHERSECRVRGGLTGGAHPSPRVRFAHVGPLPQGERETAGKRVAVVGSGPAGLAAAYTLLRNGVACTVIEANQDPGGALRGIPESQLPRAVLEADLAAVAALGVEFWFGARLGKTVSLEQLRHDFDAVVLATGTAPAGTLESLGVTLGVQGRTSLPNVFAAGGVLGERKMAVRSIAEGKHAALLAMLLLAGEGLTPEREFTVRCGELKPDAAEIPKAERAALLDANSAPAEARRCLQCGCAKADDCKLRVLAREYGASPTRYTGTARPRTPALVEPASLPVETGTEAGPTNEVVLVDTGKCIACGVCLCVARNSGAPLGLAFVGRGFLTKIVVPFGASYTDGVGRALEECVRACPTAALAFSPRRH